MIGTNNDENDDENDGNHDDKKDEDDNDEDDVRHNKAGYVEITNTHQRTTKIEEDGYKTYILMHYGDISIGQKTKLWLYSLR